MEAKKQTLKQYTSKENINAQIKYLHALNVFHTITLTNYTTTIETEKEKIKHLQKDMSKLSFVAYQKILSDLKNYTANEKPIINKSELIYFDLMAQKDIVLKNAYCVDIKSAYATILKNDGFISDETFNYVNKLKKTERLACVGMLASRKDIFYFQGSELTGIKKDINPNENFFWYCILRNSEIMRKIAISCQSSIFFWVDGIYFKNICDAYKCMKMLESENLKYTYKRLIDFFYSATDKQDLYKCFFYENTIEKKNLKIFNLRKVDKNKETLINFLINKRKQPKTAF